MKVTIEGAESELIKIMKENAVREKRGLISFEIEESESTYQGAKRGRKKKEPDIEGKAVIEEPVKPVIEEPITNPINPIKE